MDRISVLIDDSALIDLERRYGTRFTQKALNVVKEYTGKIQDESKDIIDRAGHVDSGELIDTIQRDITTGGGDIVGEVYAGTKYARFIHEGAKHEGSEIKPHFVPFAVNPERSLLTWAIRNKVIYQKRKDGRMRKTKKPGDQWYFMNKRGKEYPINIRTGGLLVKQEPVKFFSTPFARLVPAYLERMTQIVTED